MTSGTAIDVGGLVKTFGPIRALDGLDLTVEAGEVHGFLGPNGAGKSTTLRILLGLLRADSGRVRLLGGDPWRDVERLHRRLAYVPGDVALWPNLSGGETIDLLVRLRGGEARTARRDELVERFGLDPTKRARSYSKGNRQKVALIAAFATDPELLLLDEPTSGLDPLMEEVFAACVAEATGRGATVLLSSHILSEVDRLADRVTIVRDGRTVETGGLADLRHRARTRITATLTQPAPSTFVDDGGALPGVHDLAVDGRRVTCTVDADGVGPLLTRLVGAGVTSLVTEEPTLEQLFLDAYRGPATR